MDNDSRSLPPNEREAWIQRHAAILAEALGDPGVQQEIAGLLSGEQERRQKRLATLAQELQGRELTIRLGSDDAS